MFSYNTQPGSISGTQDVKLRFPLPFQTIAWEATPSTWNESKTTLEQVLSPSKNNILSGTDKTPSVLRFTALRSKKVDKQEKKEYKDDTKAKEYKDNIINVTFGNSSK